MRKLLENYYVILIGILFFTSMTERVWNRSRAVIWSDAEGYYLYNPTVFILGDLKKMPSESLPLHKISEGVHLNKYTCGVALLQMPFFLATRAFCIIKNQQPNEVFSIHYGRAVAVAGYVYGFAGLFFLERAMRRRYSLAARFITVVTIWTGTNLYYYLTKEPGMSHTYSFFLFALLVWRLPHFYDKPTVRNAAILGLICGWIILIRPTSILILLFVFTYEITSWHGLLARFKWWIGSPKLLLISAIAGLTIWLPQIYYWYTIAGELFMYSYKGEGFLYWKNPKVAAVLFDTQNGLFLYSPMVLFMVLAICICRKDERAHPIGLSLTFVLSTLVFASWWAWFFGGAFGHRSYIEFYALYALPFGVLVERIIGSWHIIPKALAAMTWILLCAYSVKMSYLYSELGGPWDGPDWRWNWEAIIRIWSHLIR